MISIDLFKRFSSGGQVHSLKLNADWDLNKIIAVKGKSGVGKTSMLRMIAGLLKPDSGYLSIGGEVWYDSKNDIDLSIQKRNLGFLFQDYSLFPNMDVSKNIKFGVDEEDGELLDRIIEIADLGDLLKRMPNTLSGGQQQRVALARAVVRKPKLLLLDEPFSALDEEMRDKLQEEILKIKTLLDVSILWISHNMQEIHRMADEVWSMRAHADNPCEVTLSKDEDKLADTLEVISRQRHEDYELVKVILDGEVRELKLPI